MTLSPYSLFRRLCRLAIVLSMSVLPSYAVASDEVIHQVQQFLYERVSELGEDVQIDVRPPSARLAECEAPSPFLPHEDSDLTGRVSVGVKCGPDGQQVRYMRATIEVIGQYVVPAQDISPDTVITQDMLATRKTELGSLPRDAVLENGQAVGQQATRFLAAGKALTQRQLREVALVERGSRVKVEARGNGFSVSRKGEAIDSGGMGSRVRVRLGNRETLTARVTGEDHLVVDL
ncbi:flagellar basal body P-ring formation chaperone FlgA [Aidingimonas lacisalsi]|uniref:flagellar basal body P-ring formation chaperone FlgA n=1 Tax=Aidingimonas lacisalsi TaxID=2604086 RepID=UPI0011D27544|nr:flagellar basal body P-ring formation chaperone FlgA [Aidingimonas lacisalsi]